MITLKIIGFKFKSRNNKVREHEEEENRKKNE